MKTYTYIFILFSFLATKLYPQVGFTEHVIIDREHSAMDAQSVYAIDVDGDGDIDILSASYLEDKIAWYENDGAENFKIHTISQGVIGAVHVSATDMDIDGDIDILSASQYVLDHKIVWYENDGGENFVEHTIDTTVIGIPTVQSIDFDNDEDIDVLVNSYNFRNSTSKIIWYERDSLQNFTPHIIDSTAIGVVSVFAVNMDNDHDIDILTAANYSGKLTCYENDSLQNFTQKSIDSTAFGVRIVFASDINSDGNMDVIAASLNKIFWYQNNRNELFTSKIITTNVDEVNSIYTIDVDDDGDIDILSASQRDNKIAWFENDGNETFL